MKILSFIGMMASMILLLLFSFFFVIFNDSMGVTGILMLTAGMIIAVYMLIFSLTVAAQYKWGDKSSYSPMM
ncbi:MAG: hypothetical protein K0S33_501 [Bacteroidetes bacterium]|jgi:hypothetical protein|nr:hypothetical protein [Bacteroidota bacterium]